jgi:hypothetical protein
MTLFRTTFVRPAAQVLMVISGLFALAMLLTTFLLCLPIEANWDPTVPGARCGTLQQSAIATGVLNVAIDVTVICLPLPVLWVLRLLLRKSLTYEMAHIGWWAMLEGSLGVINCNLPVLQPVVSKLFGSSATKTRNTRTPNTRSHGTWNQSYISNPIKATTEHHVVYPKSHYDDGMSLQVMRAGYHNIGGRGEWASRGRGY